MSSDERAEVRASLANQDRVLAMIQRDVAETKLLAAQTNGRVRKLELWRERMVGGIEAANEAKAWRGPFLVGTGSAAAGALLASILAYLFG